MKSSASKIKMSSYDALFGEDEVAQATCDGERIQHISLSELFPFQNHPFKVLDDEKMEETKESIAKYGVLMPIIARPRLDGGYELVAGHRRKRASELLGLETIPTIVRELDDDESTIIMVDSNIQRENLLFSEKAFAYKMKLDAIKSQGKRTDLTSAQLGQKLEKSKTSIEIVAEQADDSRNQIKRYIRLTELIPTLLDMVDNKKLAFNTAVELSYLSHDDQELLLEKMVDLDVIPSLSQSTKLKKYSNDGSLSEAVIDVILSETVAKPVQVTLKKEKLGKYFPQNYSSEQMEEVITTLLEAWHNEQNL